MFVVYFSLFSFAVFPSIIWLLYFLRQDAHPEPKHLIARVFIFGALFAFLGYFLQKELVLFFSPQSTETQTTLLLLLFFQRFIFVAFFEEILKYLAFFFTVRKNSELDEPIDVVIYMITAGLGFAALENFLLLSSLEPSSLEMAKISAIRFISATLLHALSSGLLGIFMAYSYKCSARKIFFYGLLVVTLIHGIYNIFASRISTDYGLAILFLFLFFLTIGFFFFVKKIKKMKSICILH